MKTYEQWQESGQVLGEFLQIGDVVDEELQMYFLEVLPPACWSRRCIQLGEPARSDENGRPMFETLEKKGKDWVYAGVKAFPKGEKSLTYYQE